MVATNNFDYQNAPAGTMLALTDGLEAEPGDVVCASTARRSGHGVAATTVMVMGGGERTYFRFLTRVTSPDGELSETETNGIMESVRRILKEKGLCPVREERLSDQTARRAELHPEAGDFACLLTLDGCDPQPFDHPTVEPNDVIAELCDMPDDPDMEDDSISCPAEAIFLDAVRLSGGILEALDDMRRAYAMLNALVRTGAAVDGMTKVSKDAAPSEREIVRRTGIAKRKHSRQEAMLPCGDMVVIDCTNDDVDIDWRFNADYGIDDEEDWDEDWVDFGNDADYWDE